MLHLFLDSNDSYNKRKQQPYLLRLKQA